MRKFIFLIFSICQFPIAYGQLNYWQQQVNYTIDVTLNDKENSLDAFEKIEYINNSPDTLKFIWFHIWPNAYKNDKTAFADQELENGLTKFYFSGKEQKGYINRLDFKINNITADIEDHPRYIDIIKVILPSPLPPGQKIVLTTPFHVKFPFNFSRSGNDGESYQATQWFPKPAVYDKNGWHPMPYLDQGEFYSEFGNFDIRITVPKNYAVAATGELQSEEEKQWLIARKDFTWRPETEKVKQKDGSVKTVTQRFPPSSAETKTLRYIQNNVHDFAWFADKRFIVDHDTCRLSSGKTIDVFSFYTEKEKKTWEEAVLFSKKAIRHYSGQVGEYPYNVVSVVQGPASFGGGMEYPTITIISPTPSVLQLSVLIVHEIGHNWFYGILASNERDHPWMDEGTNSFYVHRFAASDFGQVPSRERTFFESFEAEKMDQPIETPATNFSAANYFLIVYHKTSEWFRWLEKELGRENFDKAMQQYYQRWQFKHPQPEDFKRSLEESTGKNLDSAFTLLGKTGLLPNQKRYGTLFTPIVNPGYYKIFVNNNVQNLLSVGPMIGVNSYDNFMIGAFFTNVKLPPNKFKFFLGSLYSTGAKKMNGIGKLDYTFFPRRSVRKIDIFLNGSTFSMNKFTDTAGKNYLLRFQKIVPGIRFTFREKNPRSYSKHYIQWKTFLISEEGLQFSRDTVFNGPDTSLVTHISKTKENRSLNQLLFVVENARVLYPYRAELRFEQTTDFAKAGFTGNYFFNYSKTGGLDVRLFAGKFFYLGTKTITKQFNNDRYHFNLTGPNGYEDYTYSDYFIGRNKFEHLPSQQIMMRDGGFKIRTDLLAAKVGKTDDWLMAVNFISSIPTGLNQFPLKVFFDLGTYAEAWKKDAEGDRFLYEAGLQISVYKNMLNIYLPIIYSKVYKDYFQTILEKKDRPWKTISFNIDISNFTWKKIDRNIPF